MTLAIALIACAAYAGGQNENDVVKAPEITIHEAVVTGDIKAVERHIAAGSDINLKDEYGSTPLIVAATFGVTDAVELLIDAGADLSAANGEGSTPLHVAAFFCRTDIVKALLAAGADRNAKNLAGRTALDSVSAPFEDVKPIYDGISASLAPLGLRLDYKHIEQARPEIAQMLSS